jgi:hypothetical protein
MLLSRSFATTSQGSVLLPVADLFNHALEPTVAQVKMPLGASIFGHEHNAAFVTVRPVVKGEQLTFSYGLRSNWELLMIYGFVLPNNPHGTCCVGCFLRCVSHAAPR